MVQVVFEQLYDAGLREFYYVVGRRKRGILDYFTPDLNYISSLEVMGKKWTCFRPSRFSIRNLRRQQLCGLINLNQKG